MFVNIRKAQPTDAKWLVELNCQLGYVIDEKNLYSNLVNILQDEKQIFYVADLSKVIGFIHGIIISPVYYETCVWCGGFVVNLSQRNLGIGGKLIQSLENWAKSNKIKHILIHSSITREAGHQFYQHRGYQKVKQQYLFAKNL